MFEFFRCPRKEAKAECYDVARFAAGAYGSVLPAPGGVGQQCATWVQALRFMRSEMLDYQRKAQEAPGK